MTISELKRALKEANRICQVNDCINTCPFFDKQRMICRLKGAPNVWFVDDWKEDAQDATQGTDKAE